MSAKPRIASQLVFPRFFLLILRVRCFVCQFSIRPTGFRSSHILRLVFQPDRYFDRGYRMRAWSSGHQANIEDQVERRSR